MIFYRVVRAVLLAVCRPYFRLRVTGAEHVPRAGAFVLAPVHRSFIDFALVSAVTRRRMRFMGKDSLWKARWFGRILDALGAFPVHRGAADRHALRRSIEVVEGGEALVIFPEGTRRFGPTVEDLFEGAAYVATKAGVPIVPVGIGGSEQALRKGKKLPRPVKVCIVVGEPIVPVAAGEGRASRRAVHEVTQELQKELQQLFDTARARAGAPESAGPETTATTT